MSLYNPGHLQIAADELASGFHALVQPRFTFRLGWCFIAESLIDEPIREERSAWRLKFRALPTDWGPRRPPVPAAFPSTNPKLAILDE